MRYVIVLVGLLLVATACSDEAATVAAESPTTLTATTVPGASTVTPDVSGPDIGVALSPKSYTEPDFPDFLALVNGRVDLLMHAGDWAELDSPASPFHVLATLAEQQGAEAVVVLGPSSAEHLIRPLDVATTERYLGSLRAFLTEGRFFVRGIVLWRTW